MWKATVQPKHRVSHRHFPSDFGTLFLLIVVLLIVLRSTDNFDPFYIIWFCIGGIWKLQAGHWILLNKDRKWTNCCFLFAALLLMKIQNWKSIEDLRNMYTLTRSVSTFSLLGSSLVEFKLLSDSLLLHFLFGVGTTESDLTGAKLLSSSFRFLRRQHKAVITCNNRNSKKYL